ncbi:hypothetical protein PENARI_c005G09155 [Penicillium arizonense]|uniref:Aflatoxin regulatory protein domain-containing protein n=1 Tax=Penicillium arizonense TaxID=1835702 RepID=A0A1F5LNN2_PENAI|nr:hypothetical protein PENARI_c005G09155 [Penicillium arizonense]OGE54824.1 hypothetical protein PENARI_c005G09155 [Penicillium arizonense]
MAVPLLPRRCGLHAIDVRCLKAKEPKSCTFSRRLRTGKPRGNGESDKRPGLSRRERSASKTSVPGMSVFTLSSLSTPETASDELARPNMPSPMGQEHNTHETFPSVTFLGGLWGQDNFMLHCAQRDQIDALAYLEPVTGQPDEDPCSSDTKESLDLLAGTAYDDLAGFLDSAGPCPSPPYTIDPDLALQLDMDKRASMDPLAGERPNLLVDLSTLLSKMAHYETQLADLDGSKLENYPIGDALFLSKRFYAIITDHSHLPTINVSSDLDMPSRLLTLSCYITQTRIYSAVFAYLREHLSKPSDPCSAHRPTHFPHSLMADINAYQGLRLGQLQTSCMCVGFETAMRTKRAVSMLLDALNDIERALGLPGTFRAAQSQVSREMSQGTTVDTVPLFDESVMTGLENGRWQKKIREEERQLCDKVEDVDYLLRSLLAST